MTNVTEINIEKPVDIKKDLRCIYHFIHRTAWTKDCYKKAVKKHGYIHPDDQGFHDLEAHMFQLNKLWESTMDSFDRVLTQLKVDSLDFPNALDEEWGLEDD